MLPTYTYGDVQRAIWTLIDDTLSNLSLGPYSRCHVEEIIAAAYANGEGFIPGCNDKWELSFSRLMVSRLLSPRLPLPEGVPCDPLFAYETAWGAGICLFRQKLGYIFYLCSTIFQCGGLDGCEPPQRVASVLKVVKMYPGHQFHHQPAHGSAHHSLSYQTAPAAVCSAVFSPLQTPTVDTA